MSYRRFHHLLRILLNLEDEDLTRAGALGPDDEKARAAFRQNPFTFFIRAGDERGGRIWRLMRRVASGKERGA